MPRTIPGYWPLHPFKNDTRRRLTMAERMKQHIGPVAWMGPTEPGSVRTQHNVYAGDDPHKRFYVPTADDLATVRERYRDADPAHPPWVRIRADLFGGGVGLDTLEKMTAPEVVRALKAASSVRADAEDRQVGPAVGVHMPLQELARELLAYIEHPDGADAECDAYVRRLEGAAARAFARHVKEDPKRFGWFDRDILPKSVYGHEDEWRRLWQMIALMIAAVEPERFGDFNSVRGGKAAKPDRPGIDVTYCEGSWVQRARDDARILETLARLAQTRTEDETSESHDRPTHEADQAASDDGRADDTHSPDFRSVRWNGQVYSFTPNQAACVRVLQEALEAGTPEVGKDYLLTKAEVGETVRVVDVFRGSDAWGTMIVKGSTSGTYRIADHPEKT